MATHGAKRRTSKTMGRYQSADQRGRYTPPRPATASHSAHWYGWMLLDLLMFGLLVIVLNYLQVLPGSTSSWYLVVGLVSLFVAFYLATRYR
ncbi:MAG: cell division protein CrgA [Acidimicrobiales bacterium]